MTKKKEIGVKKIPHKIASNKLSETVIVAMLTDIWGNNMTGKDVAAKYGLARPTVSRYKNARLADKEKYTKCNPGSVMTRVDLTDSQRYDKLCQDARENLEMSFALMNQILSDCLVEPEKRKKMEVKDITGFIKEVAPYVLEKKTPPQNAKKDGSSAPKVKAFDVFKNQIHKAQ